MLYNNFQAYYLIIKQCTGGKREHQTTINYRVGILIKNNRGLSAISCNVLKPLIIIHLILLMPGADGVCYYVVPLFITVNAVGGTREKY